MQPNTPHQYLFQNDVAELNDYFKTKLNPLTSNPTPITEDNVTTSNINFTKFKTTHLKHEAEHYLKQSIKFYHAAALRELSLLIRDNYPDEANEYLHLSAVQGYADALYDLAVAYHSNPLCYNLAKKPDYHLAGLLYRAAAYLGNAEAECVIAGAYFRGEFGFPYSPSEGQKQLEKLQKQGNKIADAAIKANKAFANMPELASEIGALDDDSQ